MNTKGYIVVLEDDPLIRPLLERWLGEDGYRVLPPGAVEPDKAPCLLIVDVPSPQGAQPRMRALEARYAAPILVLSARFRRGLAGSAEAARQLGARIVLPKPFTREELLSAVREVCEGGA